MKNKNLVVTIVFLGVIVFSSSVAMAKVQGLCAQCHTMHHSQSPWPAEWNMDPDDEPLGALLVGSGGCIGCHTAPTGVQNDGTGVIPYIDQTSIPNYGDTGTEGNTLAGGTFYFVRNGADEKGHNVEGVTISEDGELGNEPPGYDAALGGTLGLPAGPWGANRLTCAGAYGCHGDHTESDPFGAVRGGHHGTDTPPLDGNTVATSYRFLLGIIGVECPKDPVGHKWEYQPTNAIHNQYNGLDRASDDYLSTDTISYLCAECHGFFHSATGAPGDLATAGTAGTASFTSPWVRHPTDFDMTNASTDEYAIDPGYNPPTHNYNPIAPLASEGADELADIVSTISFSTTDAIVTCISCHRAHGTNWADLLRWDYATMDAGQTPTPTDEGCFICHTTK